METEHHPRVKWRVGEPTAKQIRRLGRFDLVLGLSALHRMDDFGAAYWALHSIADQFVAIEPPHYHERLAHGVTRCKLLHALAISHGRTIFEAPAYPDRFLMRPLVLGPPSAPQGVSGKVFSGVGLNVYQFMKMRWTREALGFKKFKGTLSIDLPYDTVDRSGPYTEVSTRFGPWRFWPVLVDGIRCHALQNPQGGPESVEVIAAVDLRVVLDLEDGDSVRVKNA